MYTIQRVEATDFFSFKELDWDLTLNTGLVLIEGQRNSPTRSNGSGKSALFDAILWGLFDKVNRKLSKKEKVIRRGQNAASVRLTIDVDGDELVIERRRTKSGTTLKVLGRDAPSTKDGMQSYIEGRLGNTYETFINTTLFSGGLSSFCSKTDGERKKLLEKMLNFERYSSARDAASHEMLTLDTEHRQLEQQLSIAENSLEHNIEAKQQEVARSLSAFKKTKRKSRRLKQEVDALRLDAHSLATELAEHYDDMRGRRAELEAERARFEDAVDGYTDKIAAHTATVERNLAAISSIREKIANYRVEIREIEDDRHPDTCPTCGQLWPQNSNQSVIRQRIALIEEKIAKLEAKAIEHRHENERLEPEIKEMNKARKKYRTRLDDLVVFTDNEIEIDLITKLTEAETLLNAKIREKYEHDALFDPYTVLDTRVDHYSKRVIETRAKIESIKDRLQVNRTIHKRYAFWERGFSRQGIPAFLLDSAVPVLNETIHEIASLLTDNELIVTFDSAATKGTQDVFAVQVDYVDGADEYDASSNGEHTRVDLAVLFSLRELLASRGRNQCTQLFLDEVFDGLDEAGSESVMRMLRNFHGDKTAFVISHDPAVKNLVDHVLVVHKYDGYSRLVA